MKINIISFGVFKKLDPYLNLFEEYKKRINFNINLIEIKSHSNYKNIEEQKEYEGFEILKKLNKGNKIIVLDEHGKIITTNEFVNIINKYSINSDIDFIIGGTNGLPNFII